MAKFRMVPDDADEAKFIHELIKAHNTTALMEAAKTGDVGLMNKLTSREIRWQVIATELAAGDDEPEPAKPTAPAASAKAPKSAGKPAPAATSSTPAPDTK